MAAAAAVSLLFAGLVVSRRVNQVIAGLAVVFFCQGLTTLLGQVLRWQNHPVTGLLGIDLPGLTTLPVLGRLLFGQTVATYLVAPIFAVAAYVLRRTMAGLWLRAVGENPEAADAAGVSVPSTRYAAIVAGAALIGLAGGLLSVGQGQIWFPQMTGGRGWIAVALVILARWQPWRALAGAVLFGGIESLVPRIAAAGIQALEYLMLMTPYLATLGVTVWTAVGRAGLGLRAGGAALMRVDVYGKAHDVGAEFADHLDPRHAAVVSIDMHRGHLEDSPDCPCPAPRARALVAPIDASHAAARMLGVPVVHVRSMLRRGGVDDVSGIPSAWRRTFPLHVGPIPNSAAHAIEGTRWTEFVTAVAPGDLVVETKRRLSAFYATDLDLLLRNLGVRSVVLNGGFTDCCVLNTAFDAANRTYRVAVLRDLVRSTDDGLEAAALAMVSLHLGLVACSADLLDAWRWMLPAA